MTGIYKITNTINNKSYIGQSCNIQQRWLDEKKKAFEPNSTSYDLLLSRALRHYGVSAFEFEVVEECAVEELDEKEQYYIHYFNTYMPDGYNMTYGGGGVRGYSHKLTTDQINELQNLLINSTESQLDLAIKFGISKDAITDINLGRTHFNSNYHYPLRAHKHYCQLCGAEISSDAQLCRDCAQYQNRKVQQRPDRNTLLLEIVQLGFVGVGRKYGVSDKAVCKWCKKYGLPTRKKELVQLYHDESLG